MVHTLSHAAVEVEGHVATERAGVLLHKYRLGRLQIGVKGAEMPRVVGKNFVEEHIVAQRPSGSPTSCDAAHGLLKLAAHGVEGGLALGRDLRHMLGPFES